MQTLFLSRGSRAVWECHWLVAISMGAVCKSLVLLPLLTAAKVPEKLSGDIFALYKYLKQG